MSPDLNGEATALKLCSKRVAVGAGTQTFAGIDIRDFVDGCKAKIVIGHEELSGSGSTSIQYSLLDSADNTTFAASAGLPTIAANTAASATIEFAIDPSVSKRYLQLKALTASATATFDIGAFFVGFKALD
jgi:hypothetical protein